MKSSTCFCRFVSAIETPDTIVGEQKVKIKRNPEAPGQWRSPWLDLFAEQNGAAERPGAAPALHTRSDGERPVASRTASLATIAGRGKHCIQIAPGVRRAKPAN